MVKKNIALKTAIFASGITLQQISDETGIPRMYLSQAQNGKYNLSDEQKLLVAKALKRNVKKLFED